LLKGNKTREFWTYLANQKEYSVCCFPVLNNTEQAELVGNHALINNNQKRFIGKVVIRAGNQKPIIENWSLSNLKNVSVKVFNLSGQLVSAGLYSENLFSSLHSGIYLLVLDNGEKGN
ncbi:MAG: T9SS type A sorting domain-containing protein, partial [Ignavibacteria bacterium]|nr:T9SS type A sorting domain-containing protein [Ignavibacteria bacterium]